MAPGDLRSFVEHGIDRAASYKIEAERDVCKYLNLMAVFGRNFDVELPWAKETLASAAGPGLKLTRLYARGERSADERTEPMSAEGDALRKSGAAAESRLRQPRGRFPGQAVQAEILDRFPARGQEREAGQRNAFPPRGYRGPHLRRYNGLGRMRRRGQHRSGKLPDLFPRAGFTEAGVNRRVSGSGYPAWTRPGAVRWPRVGCRSSSTALPLIVTLAMRPCGVRATSHTLRGRIAHRQLRLWPRCCRVRSRAHARS